MAKRAYKTEIVLNPNQVVKYRKTVGVCRYVYNMFVDMNEALYDLFDDQPYMDNAEFSKWLNNEHKAKYPEESWVHEVSSKSVRKVIDEANDAYNKFMKGQAGFPNKKKKWTNDCTMYFVRNEKSKPIECDRHRIKIPTLGWVKIKEKGYIPWGKKAVNIISGRVTYRGGRYFVSVIVEYDETKNAPEKTTGEPIGGDVGIKNYITLSDDRVIPNFNKVNKRIRFLDKKLNNLHRKASRQLEDYKKRKRKDLNATKKNLEKTYDMIRKVELELDNLRSQAIRDIVREVTRTKPSHISIEDLNVSGMMKNKHLANSIQFLRWYDFRVELERACRKLGIELRLVNRWFPSSKTCHKCGHVENNLKLSDRVFECSECHHVDDRDNNASLNLRDAEDYVVLTT